MEPLEAVIAAETTAQTPQRLDPRSIRLWRLTLLVQTVVVAGGLLAVASLTAWSLLWVVLALLVVVAGGVLVVVWPPAQYRNWSFEVRETDLFVRYGVLWRTTSVIPHSRIQHVDTRRGPLERWLGLARVIIYTAGVRGADLVIPGLSLAEAEALRDRLAVLGGGEDAV